MLLTASMEFDFQTGWLGITGTEDADQIALFAENNYLRVTGASGTDITSVTAASVVSIHIDAGLGGDTIDLSGVLSADFSALVSIELFGSGGNDTIYGSQLKDTIDGGAGDDTLTGGSGSDVYVFNPAAGNLGSDTIVEVANADRDTLDFGAFSGAIMIDLGSTATQIVATDVLTLALSSDTGIENVIGGSGDDTIIGNAAENFLYGEEGNDVLYGMDGSDVLNGGPGTDRLYGGSGANGILDGEGQWLVRFNNVPGDTFQEQFDYIRALFHNAALDQQGIEASAHVGVDGVVLVQADPASDLETVQGQLGTLSGFDMLEEWDEGASPADRQIFVPPPPGLESEGELPGEPGPPVESDATPLVAQGLLAGFNGRNHSQTTAQTPPDPAAAAGPNHIVEVVNDVVAIYNKAGTLLFAQTLYNWVPSLFGASGTTDPVVLYNDILNSFFVGFLDYSLAFGNVFFEVAISDTSDAMGQWHTYRYNVNDGVGASFDFADYPKAGYNADGWVISFNMFPNFAFFDHISVLSISGSNPANAWLRVMPGLNTNFTLAPASMHGAAPGTPMWFVGDGHGGGGGNTINVVRLNNPFSSAAVSVTTTAISVPSFGNVRNPRQPGGVIGGLDLLGTRFYFSALRTVGGLTHLVSAQTIGNGTGVSARWYDINVTSTPSLLQSGTINSSPSSIDTYLPTVDIAPDGTIGINYSQSGTSQYMAMYVTAHLPTGASGSVVSPVLAVQSSVALVAGGRVGDYSFTSVDPVDGTFWAVNEYAANIPAYNWGTWIQHFDLTPPAAPVITGIINDTGFSATDGITSDTSLTVTGTAEPNATITVYDGAVQLGMAVANGSGGWSYVDTRTLGNGTSHPYTAKATDAAGNTSGSSAAFTAAIDTTAPAAPVISGIVNDTGVSATDGITSDTSLTITGTSEGNAIITVYDNAVQLGMATANASGVWSYVDTRTLANGTSHPYTARATDLAGNVGALSSIFTATIDTVAPNAPVITGIVNDTGISSTDGITSDTSLTITGTSEANATITVYDSAVQLGTTTANGSGSWSYVDTRTLNNGTSHPYTARATDVAGNTSSLSSAFTAVIDTAAPNAPIITGIVNDTGVSSTDGITSDTSLTITGTAEANAIITVYDNAVQLGTTTANASGVWSYVDARTLTNGSTHPYTARATDVAGNIGSLSGAFTAAIDSAPPKITGVTIGSTLVTVNNPDYDLPAGSGEQLRSIPVRQANEIMIHFSETVNVQKPHLTIQDATTSTSYDVAGSTFTYDTATNTGKWIFAQAFVVDGDAATARILQAIQITMSAALTDIAGNALDGEWTNPTSLTQTGTSTWPSGNGFAGGDFQFNFSILLGDVNHDNVITGSDIDYLLANIYQPNPSPYLDLDNNGIFNQDDEDYLIAVLFKTHYGDADLNGGNDLTDYNMWRTGAGGSWAGGDFDGSGGVPDLNDYNLWRTAPSAI